MRSSYLSERHNNVGTSDRRMFWQRPQNGRPHVLLPCHLLASSAEIHGNCLDCAMMTEIRREQAFAETAVSDA
ncbi:MAG: hypothetical protein MK110_03900 [Fuerstiella sp.]|nr:hypothetical protein [Fuerstiella sp.]